VRYDERNPVEKNSEIDGDDPWVIGWPRGAEKQVAVATHGNNIGFWYEGRWRFQPPTFLLAVVIIVAESARQHAHCGKAVDADRSCGE
jgi:hypothetical protein